MPEQESQVSQDTVEAIEPATRRWFLEIEPPKSLTIMCLERHMGLAHVRGTLARNPGPAAARESVAHLEWTRKPVLHG
jgi:hypothetical protein